ENFYSSGQHYENSSENQAPSGITCAVCRSTYNAHDRRPLIFSSCGHTFCEECLRTENRKSVFRCPSCRQDRDQFWTLKPNFALLDLLEAKGLRMDDDDLLSLALHMSAQEAENKEYRRQVAALLAREPAGAGDVPGAEGGWQEEAEGRPGKEEAYCHEELEGHSRKKLRLEKEKAEREENIWLEEERTTVGHGYVIISPDE
ncbi:Protein-L-isoaspartate O-methyltransferase, partial [Penaeus vannamei]